MTAFSVVVVTHNSASELVRLLDSIESHLSPAPQVIVVDADSRDHTVKVARDRAEVVELGENPGFGAASNAGVKRATAGVTVLLNPDVVALDAGLATLAGRAARREVLLAPRLLNADGTVQRSVHPLPGRARSLLPAVVHPRLLPRGPRLSADPWRSDERRLVGWALAACLAARTETLRLLGPFDPGQFLFFEDMDLCLRARARGIPTELHPDVRLVHTGSHSTGPAFGGEPHELLARRRREVVGARLGRRALLVDDVAQELTFAARAAARFALRRDHARPSAQLAAQRRARRAAE
jgi:N-acetylglucosaminyl-diphospho-decaprenol L-rhamnosyltransferase